MFVFFFHFCILFRSLICSFYHNLQFHSSVFTFCHFSPLGLSYLIYEAFFLLLYWSLSLSFFATNSFEVPYFDRGGGGWSYLISRAFFIIYLNFLSWFRNTLKSCRNIKKSFQLFQAYIKTSDLYISLSFYFSFFFGFLVLLCMIVYILRYPFLYRIYLCILWIYFFSLCLCTPFSFFKIIFPSISLLYIFTLLLQFWQNPLPKQKSQLATFSHAQARIWITAVVRDIHPSAHCTHIVLPSVPYLSAV